MQRLFLLAASLDQLKPLPLIQLAHIGAYVFESHLRQHDVELVAAQCRDAFARQHAAFTLAQRYDRGVKGTAAKIVN